MRLLTKVGRASWQFSEAETANAALAMMGFQPPEATGHPEDWTARPHDGTASRGQARIADLIVLDEDMPGGMPGSAAMRALRKAGSTAVIVGFSGSAMAAEHFAAGADLSWSKPLPSEQELSASLMSAFRKRGFA